MSLSLKEKHCGLEELKGILEKMAVAIAETPHRFKSLAFIGILQGGAPIADYLAKRVGALKGMFFPVAYLDISLYRDDTVDTQSSPYSRATEIPFAVKNKEIVLVDDVLFTGRTACAALTTILSLGRPRLIRLAVVVDRGFRELPIHADIVGRVIEAPREQGVRVYTGDRFQDKGVFILQESAQAGA